jgi:hypothetical protein
MVILQAFSSRTRLIRVPRLDIRRGITSRAGASTRLITSVKLGKELLDIPKRNLGLLIVKGLLDLSILEGMKVSFQD